MKKQNLIGQKYNLLTVVSFAETRNKISYWNCECKCGNKKTISGKDLKSNHTKSCGCLNQTPKYTDLTGQKFNLLTVKSYAYSKDNRPYWNCICECGKEKVILGKDLKSGHTKSCGCLNQKAKYDDLTGQKFGMLTVTSYSKALNLITYFNVKCDCGVEKEVRANDLKNGKTTSCGCRISIPTLKVGDKISKLTVIEQVKGKRSGIFLKCVCDCGNEIVTNQSSIIRGITTSCGCNRAGVNIKDLTGQVFGNLIVIDYSHTDKYAYWNCKCGCGNEKKIKSTYLIERENISCGCLHRGYREFGTIYGIYDNKGILKYVGQTVKVKLSARLKGHISNPSSSKMKEWLDTIDYRPRIKTLVKNVPFLDIYTKEKEVIEFYRKKVELLNIIHN
jgi:hypothetical protein